MLALWHRSSLVTLAAALLVSCSSTETLDPSGACIEGQSTRCACGDGAVGVRTCGQTNAYGACDCSGQLTSGSGGTEPLGGAAGNATGGSSGDGGSAGANPAAGTGGSVGTFAGVGGSAGSGVGGAAGMTGGTGGSAGISGAGGAGGMDPIGGQSGDGNGGDGGNGREPQPGELYGDCPSDGACDDALLCVNDSSSGLAESYCSTTCDAFAPMPCPRMRGDRMALCLLGICVR